MKYEFHEGKVTTELGFGTLNISSDDTKGFRPFQLLVSSVAACSGAVFKRVLEKRRIDYDSFTIDASVERNEKQANRIEIIQLIFKVSGQDLNREQLEKSLAISSRNCAMVRSVKDSIKIVEKIELV